MTKSIPDPHTPHRFARLIYNPAAGRGRAKGLLPEIQRALQAVEIETEVAQTGAAG